MEFEGKIVRLLPIVSGESAKGKWKVLPLVFEFKERESDRSSDRVVLETLDRDVINSLSPYVQRQADGTWYKTEDGSTPLLKSVPCRIGFGHTVREYNGKFFNRLWMYSFNIVDNSLFSQATPSTPIPSSQGEDDMPF